MDKVAEALIESGAVTPKNDVAASLTAYSPSVRERIGNSIYDIARYLSMDSIANRLRNDVETGIDFVPLVGDAIGFDDAARDISAGNYGAGAAGLGLAALGVVPGVGDAIAAGGRKILSSGAENARVVADMLASGRANEVTNDMISAADPSELWKLYESGATGVPMPMDTASRMARAKEMGFDTAGYHGTTKDFSAFNPESYTSPDPSYANIYAGGQFDEGGNVIPLMQRSGNILDTRTASGRDVFDNDFFMQYGNGTPLTQRGVPDWTDGPDFGEMFSDLGIPYNGVYLDEGKIPLGDGTVLDRGISTLHFDPTNIRSQFARFDPRLKHLSHLSAGLAGAVAAGTISLEVANQMQELGQDYQP